MTSEREQEGNVPNPFSKSRKPMAELFDRID
jgi:hypothetical protein